MAAKYCDEYVCVSVCLSVREHISGATRAIFTKFFYACCLCPWLSPPLAGWWNPKGKGQFWGFPPYWQCIVTRSLQKGSFHIGREWSDGNAQRGRSVIYYLVFLLCYSVIRLINDKWWCVFRLRHSFYRQITKRYTAYRIAVSYCL